MGLVQLIPGSTVRKGNDWYKVIGNAITNPNHAVKSLPCISDVSYSMKAVSGIWLLMFLNRADAERLAIPGGEPVDKLHLTIGQLDPESMTGKQDIINRILEEAVTDLPPVQGKIGSIGQFLIDDGNSVPVVALFDSVQLETWRDRLLGTLKAIGVELLSDHGYTPHITLMYRDGGLDSLPDVEKREIELGALSLVWEGNRKDFRLVGQDVKGGPGSGNFGHAGRPGYVGGSSPTHGAALGGLTQKVISRASRGVSEVQRLGIRTGNEAAYSVSRDGKKNNGTIRGSTDACDLSNLTGYDNFLTIHNHPESSSFSGADVAMLFSPNVGSQHMIVVGHDGTLYRLSKMKDTPKDFYAMYDKMFGEGMADGLRRRTHNDDVAAFRIFARDMTMWHSENLSDAGVSSGISDRIREGKIGKEVGFREQSHIAMEATAKEFGLKYERIEPR